MSIAVINFGFGNFVSVSNALLKCGIEHEVVEDPLYLRNFHAAILPGVGNFETASIELMKNGRKESLEEFAIEKGRPLLGICLGFQLLTIASEESKYPGLGWLDALTVEIPKNRKENKGFHVGWTEIEIIQRHPLWNEIDLGQEIAEYYFSHGFAVQPLKLDQVQARAKIGQFEFTAVMRKRNIFGVQFHPEKSHVKGRALLQNFASFVSSSI